MAKKIYITKNDTAEMAVIKLLKSKGDKITLSIPNFSQLANSLENFRLIKKEADEAGKEVVIESVDDMIVELAHRSDLKAINPFFVSQRKKNIRPLEPQPMVLEKAESSFETAEEDEEEYGPSVIRHHRGTNIGLMASMLLVALLLPGGYVAYRILPQASVNIVTQKMDWDYKASLTVDKAALALSVESDKIPGQVFNLKKNAQFSFPATGKKKLNKKSTGSIIIYNNHSSAPQTLVASTRFETSDGKIFRLVEQVTVPGAKVVDGKVTPSSLVAKVIADRGGEDYNIGAVEKFTIPGFKHAPKYDTFWGASTEPMKGGFTGESAYPTDEDIKKAKEKAVLVLEENLKMLIKNEIPQGFQLVDGASKFILLKQTINTGVDEGNEFSVFSDAEFNVMAFRESDVKEVISEKIKKELTASLQTKTSALTYGQASLDLTKGIMALPVVYEAQLEYPIDTEQLKEKLVGKSELELKALLFALPGLSSAKVSFWPFWVNKVPATDKVDIKIE